MSRTAKGARLYLRRGRTDSRSGKKLPDRWFIRDGQIEISTGCGPDGLSGPGGAEEQLGQYLLEKGAEPAPAEPTERQRRSDPDRVYIAEVLAEYALGKAPKVANPEKESSFIKTLLPWWGERVVSDVRRSNCEAYVAKRMTDPHRSYKDPKTAPRVSAQTARRELECLSTAISYWHEEHHLRNKPEVVLPEKPDSPRDALTRSEAASLLIAAMGWRRSETNKWARLGKTAKANRMHLRRFILLGLYTGTRSAVIMRLHWVESLHDPWVDLEHGVIYRRGRHEKDERTKRRPVVKIPDRLLAHMRRWHAQDEKRGLSTVIHFGGEQMERIHTAFESCAADAGLTGPTPHWLRHTCCTWLMERGTDLWEAAGYAGMSAMTLSKHYGHHRPDYQSAARKNLA
ncbi:MAG: tyrosine-type recombinase/integrase [Brevundimonas sp.]|nr:tyrosine-type recombinase/integrase [Brevundimonas sp.]